MIRVLVKRIICGILVHVILSIIKHVKIGEYLDVKGSSCEKWLIRKLVLQYENEILNATETSLDDKTVTYAKNNCLILKISLGVVYLLLIVVICVTCYFCYKNHRSKQKHLLPYLYKLKMGNNFKDIDSTYYFLITWSI